MSNQSDKVLMGTTQSSFKTVDNVPGVIAAGKVVYSKSDGTYSSIADGGSIIGVSLGKDLSDIGRTSVVRRGIGVPILLTTDFNPSIGTQVSIDGATGMAIDVIAPGATGVNATYASGRVGGVGVEINKGLDEDGVLVGVAIIDFPGGL